MADYSPAALLGAAHDRSQFDCGIEPLNAYLKQYALQNQKKGIVRNYVVCRDTRIVGYYSLAYGSVAQTEAPAAIAKGIARLERRLRTRLFHRTTRRQSLTESGEAYYEHCKRALAELDAAEAVFDHGRRERSGISIGSIKAAVEAAPESPAGLRRPAPGDPQ